MDDHQALGNGYQYQSVTVSSKQTGLDVYFCGSWKVVAKDSLQYCCVRGDQLRPGKKSVAVLNAKGSANAVRKQIGIRRDSQDL